MATDPGVYLPINCEFHDLLEALATTHAPARIVFLDAQGVKQQRTVQVADVYARDGAEYLALANGEILRLDQLLQVDSEKLADY